MTNRVVLHDAALKQWLDLREPCEVIRADRLDEVIPRLRRIERMVRELGLYAAGFISYEAAPAFDAALHVHPSSSFPLFWFGLYSQPQVIQLSPPAPSPAYTLGDWSPSVSRQAYDGAIAGIKEYIARGETYQVNYSFRLRAPFSGDTWDFFLKLVQAQQADYSAYVDTGQFTVCSASPELFFRLEGSQFTGRPMKGTAPRGRTLAEDNAMARWLQHSEKNRAENVMIVDMIRNDMGRVAHVGSVRVPSLFDVERYPTLWQMTSTVTATTDASLCDIVAALFPCASITGAPKPRTMQIIRRLETTPRRIYTGCIGFMAPNRRAQFNVAIRTVLIDEQTGQAEYGVGGGIVWDSVTDDEYAECRVKAKVLTADRAEFSLLETMLWTPDDGYFLLPYHLRRLRDSAAYFGIPAEMDGIREELVALAASYPKEPHRVRLPVAQDGGISCQATPLSRTTLPQPVRLRLAPAPVDSAHPLLYHKTTHRPMYDAARAACPDSDDVLLWNERGEITETCMANVVVQLDGQLLTPPVQCGLLPGTFRAYLLDQGKLREEVITIEALKRCTRIYVVNSVRKWCEALLV